MDNPVARIIETSFDTMCRIVIGVNIIIERVDMERILFASHIGKGRGAKRLFRWTPDKEIAIFVSKEIDVETVIDNSVLNVRLAVSQVSSDTETFVVSLFAVSFVRKEIHASANIEITDAATVRKVESFVHRVAYTREEAVAQNRLHFILAIFPETLVAPLITAVFRVSVDTDIGTHFCFRSEARTGSTYIDNPV